VVRAVLGIALLVVLATGIRPGLGDDGDSASLALDQLEQRALHVDYDVTTVRLWPVECSRADAIRLFELLDAAWDAGADDDSRVQALSDALLAWSRSLPAPEPQSRRERKRQRRRAANPGHRTNRWRLGLRGDERRVQTPIGGQNSTLTIRAPGGTAWSIRNGDREFVGVDFGLGERRGENVEGWPWQLLGDPGEDSAATLRALLSSVTAAPSGASAPLTSCISESTPGVERRSRFEHDRSHSPLPRLALHVIVRERPVERAQLEAYAFGVREVQFAPADSMPFRVSVGAKAEITAVSLAGEMQQGTGSAPERWPAAWFRWFDPPAQWAELAERVRATGRSPGSDVEDIRAALGRGDLPRHGSLIGVALAALLGAGIIALTFRLTRRPRPRLLSVGVAGVLAVVAFGLSVGVTTPDRVWCLDRTPQFGAEWIVALSPGGGALSGGWSMDDGAALLRLSNRRMGVAGELDRETGGAEVTVYVRSGGEQASEQGAWREYLRSR
jgi:hypothetical protein